MKTKKKLVVFLPLILFIAVCFTVSDYSWAASTNDEAYMVTSVKPVHTNSPVVWIANGYNYMSPEGDYQASARCHVCGAWIDTLAQHNVEFTDTSNYLPVYGQITYGSYFAHAAYHEMVCNNEDNGWGGNVNPKSTKIYLKQDLYEVTGIAPVKK